MRKAVLRRIAMLAMYASLLTLGVTQGHAEMMPGEALGQSSKPNILVIMGDDIGIPNISKFSFGMMGYRTANIDRIADE